MEDHNWLLQFQSNRVDVEPGDALRTLLETTINFDDDGVEIESHYRILKVLDVIKSRSVASDDLFDE